MIDVLKEIEKKLDRYLSAGGLLDIIPSVGSDSDEGEMTPFDVMVDMLNLSCTLILSNGSSFSVSKSWPRTSHYSWVVSFNDGTRGYIASDGNQSVSLVKLLYIDSFLRCIYKEKIKTLVELDVALIQKDCDDNCIEFRLPHRFCVSSGAKKSGCSDCGMPIKEIESYLEQFSKDSQSKPDLRDCNGRELFFNTQKLTGWNWEFSLVCRYDKVWVHNCGSLFFNAGRGVTVFVRTELMAQDDCGEFYDFWTVYRIFKIREEQESTSGEILNDFLVRMDWTNVHDTFTRASTAGDTDWNGSVPFNLDSLESTSPVSMDEYVLEMTGA